MNLNLNKILNEKALEKTIFSVEKRLKVKIRVSKLES